MKKHIPIYLALLCMIKLVGQEVQSHMEMPMRPIDPVQNIDIIGTSFKKEADTNLEYLVHHHPNGKDFVLTPYHWGESPDASKKLLIDDAMQAITDSRETYAEFGEVTSDLFYILDELDRDNLGMAYWLVENTCWMRSGVPDVSPLDQGDRKQVFAHEIGHCMIMEKVAQLKRNYNTLNAWFDESMAECLSSLVYPSNNFEYGYATNFDLDGQAFTQRYNAYPLMYYYLKKNGMDQLFDFLNQLTTKDTRPLRLAHMRRKEFDRLYHHFTVDFIKHNIKDPGGGYIPRESVDDFRQKPFIINPADPQPITFDTIPPERNSLFRVDLPAGYDITLYPPEHLGGRVFFSVHGGGKSIKEWTEREKIVGRCDETKDIYISATHLNENSVTDVTLTYELNERLGCCDSDVVISKNPPPERLDDEFSFDYHIKSTLTLFADGDERSSLFNYYVNSKDGSMLFSEDFFFHYLDKDTFGGMEIKAVIWFPNAQLVAYVVDPVGVKRAITIDMNQTASDIMGLHTFGAEAFLRNAVGSRISPAPLPPESPWNTLASGYAYHLKDVEDRLKKGRVSGYISKESSAVKTSLPFLGFMAGYIKDRENRPKTLVYSHFEDDDGNTLEEHLQQMDRQCYSFSGADYKKMTLFGDSGAIGHMTAKSEALFDEEQEKLIEELNTIVENLGKCGDDERCAAELTKRMMDIQTKMMGNLYDLPANPLYSGTAGSDFNAELKEIDKKMNVLLKKNIDKEMECLEYETAMRECEKTGGSCGVLRTEFRNCKTEHDSLKEELDKLSCQKAKLMGTEDLMDGCE
ncbi:MAG: hypothetical protein AAGA43_01875 [Bacteroidota bacterium]